MNNEIKLAILLKMRERLMFYRDANIAMCFCGLLSNAMSSLNISGEIFNNDEHKNALEMLGFLKPEMLFSEDQLYWYDPYDHQTRLNILNELINSIPQ